MKTPLLLMAGLFLSTLSLAADPGSLLITHGPRDLKLAALTFDLCQKPKFPAGFDRALIEVLKQTKTPASFFVGGDWLRTHAQEADALNDPLFELGNHSFSHPDLRKLDTAAIRSEIEQTETLLKRQFGRSPQLFRLPYGFYDERVLQTVAASGLRIIQWDLVSGDPDRNLSAEQLVNGVTRSVRNGSIIVMHANERGWQTARALPDIIRILRERGFDLVRVSTLLNRTQ